MALNLHTHLEGCVRPTTAAELATVAGVPAPVGGWETALVVRQPSNLTTFLSHVGAVYPVLGSREALYRVTREAVEDAAADGCDFLELRAGPMTHVRDGFDVMAAIEAMCAGLDDGQRATGLPAGLIVCVLRNHDEETNIAVARAAARRAGSGVVGFDVAGDELLYPSLIPFVKPFAIAVAAGLGLTAHVAEAGPAANLMDAVNTLGVHRIGHGSRVADEPAVLAWAAEHEVWFEVCPTSNVLTGAVSSVRAHPIHRFLRSGCRVVLGDDDPITTGSRLSSEVARLTTDTDVTEGAMTSMHHAAVDVAFCDKSTRDMLRVQLASGDIR